MDVLAYEYQSPYVTFNNNPIVFNDPLGLEPEESNMKGPGGPKHPKRKTGGHRTKRYGHREKVKVTGGATKTPVTGVGGGDGVTRAVRGQNQKITRGFIDWLLDLFGDHDPRHRRVPVGNWETHWETISQTIPVYQDNDEMIYDVPVRQDAITKWGNVKSIKQVDVDLDRNNLANLSFATLSGQFDNHRHLIGTSALDGIIGINSQFSLSSEYIPLLGTASAFTFTVGTLLAGIPGASNVGWGMIGGSLAPILTNRGVPSYMRSRFTSARIHIFAINPGNVSWTLRYKVKVYNRFAPNYRTTGSWLGRFLFGGR